MLPAQQREAGGQQQAGGSKFEGSLSVHQATLTMLRVPVMIRATAVLRRAPTITTSTAHAALLRRCLSTPTATAASSRWSTGNWRWTARILRGVRLAFLSIVLYQMGYSNGVTDVLEDPEGKDKELMATIIESSGATKQPLSKGHDTYKRVARVAVRIVEGGQILCARKRDEAKAEIAKLRREKGVVR